MYHNLASTSPMILLSFSAILCSCGNALLDEQAESQIKTEVDSYTQRYDRTLKDSTAEVNRETIVYLNAALNEANSTSPGNSEALYKITYKTLGGGIAWGNLETSLNNSKYIDSRRIDRANSVYKNFGITQAFALYLASLGANFKSGPFFIGSDKIGHFVEEGYQYYQKAFVEGKGLGEALLIGDREENGIFGLYTTGIFSYGDLMANFMGTFMWKDFAPNAFNKGENTYVVLENGKWKLNPKRPFSWQEYFTAGLDEALNCSKFRDEASMRPLFNKAIADLEKRDGRSYQCPVEPQLCKEFVNNFKYPEFKERLIHPACLKAALE